MQSEIAKQGWVGLAAGDIVAEAYRVERILGRSGNGLVAEVVRREDGQRFGIKVLRPDPDGDGDGVTRFLHEARAASLMKSVHVAKVFEVGPLLSGEPYFVMEYLEGHDLDAALRGEGVLPVETACDYVLQTCEALAEAHAAGIVHGNVKPRNLFLTLTPVGTTLVKLLDFGISKHAPRDLSVDLRATETRWPVASTPLYVAPEQLRATRRVDQQADVWALGVVLHECLTGQMPFYGASLAEVAAAVAVDPPVRCCAQRPDIPLDIEAIILRCLEKEPGARFNNVADLASALLPFGPPNAVLTHKRIEKVLGAARRATAPPVARASMFPSLRTSTMSFAPSGLPSIAPPPPPTDEVDAAWNDEAALGPPVERPAGPPAEPFEVAESAPKLASVAPAAPPSVPGDDDVAPEGAERASKLQTPLVPPFAEAPPVVAVSAEAPPVVAVSAEVPAVVAEERPATRVAVPSVAEASPAPALEAPAPKKPKSSVALGLGVAVVSAVVAFMLARPSPPPPQAAPLPLPTVAQATAVAPAPPPSPPPPAPKPEPKPEPPPAPPPPSAVASPEPPPLPSPSPAPAATTRKVEPASKKTHHHTPRSEARTAPSHETTTSSSPTPAPSGTAAFGATRE